MPQAPERIRVELAQRSYDIVLGSGILADLARLLPMPSGSRKVALVSDEQVAALYSSTIAHGLEEAGYEADLVQIAHGEAAKNAGTLQYLWNAFLEAGLSRRDLAVALGGGVVGDVVGFAAGTYMRGIPYLQVPTTLLAQVDSSIGGKTAIDLPGGKNMAGLIYQPIGVLIDVSTLRSLPEREYRAGLAEVVKCGLMWDANFFQYLERELESVLARRTEPLVALIRRSCAIKAQVVSSDETEGGLRRVLNLGHTAGHALEAASGYNTYRHGEAVAWGLKVVSRLAARVGAFEPQDAERVERLLERAGCLPAKPPLSVERLLEFLRRDKKAVAGKQVWVLPVAIGRVLVRDDINDDLLASVLR